MELQGASTTCPRTSFAFVDLFAGLGGFHVALKQLGGNAVLAAEWDKTLNHLYLENFGIAPWMDVANLDPAHVPNHEVLTAGFPCQPFSKAGEQLGFEHTLQGQLFFKVRDIVAEKQPSFLILENVPNILRHRGGRTLQTILDELSSIGYEVDFKRLSPHQFGIPQIRERAYFVASRAGLSHFDWPSPTPGETSIHSVLTPNVRPTRQIPIKTLRAMDVWADFLRSSKNARLPSFPIWSMEFGATYPFEDETPFALMAELGERGLRNYRGVYGSPLRGLSQGEQLDRLPSHAKRPEYSFPKWKTDFIRQNRTFYEDNKQWIDPWLKRSRIWEFESSFQKFEWNVQGGVRDLANYVLQVRASGIRVKRPTTAPSLISMTNTQVPILGWDRRYMTTEECARLQSLDGIKLPSSDIKAYAALGNAVNAEVVKKIAASLVAPLFEHQS